MNHLKKIDAQTYRFRTAEVGDMIEVEVEYSKGFSADKRGLFVRVVPLKIERCDGYSVVHLTLGSGCSWFVERLARQNKAERMDEYAEAYGGTTWEYAE